MPISGIFTTILIVFSKNSMFTDDKSYEMSIQAWVCTQNTTTGYKQVP